MSAAGRLVPPPKEEEQFSKWELERIKKCVAGCKRYKCIDGCLGERQPNSLPATTRREHSIPVMIRP